MNDLMNKIQNNLSTFSKGQRLIAKYIIEHYDKAAFLTASKLGSTVGVINALIVAIGMRKQQEISETFNHLESIWDEYEVYEKLDNE